MASLLDEVSRATSTMDSAGNAIMDTSYIVAETMLENGAQCETIKWKEPDWQSV